MPPLCRQHQKGLFVHFDANVQLNGQILHIFKKEKKNQKVPVYLRYDVTNSWAVNFGCVGES